MGNAKLTVRANDQVFDCGVVLHLKLGNPQVIQQSCINEKAELNRVLFVGLKNCESLGAAGPKRQATSCDILSQ